MGKGVWGMIAGIKKCIDEGDIKGLRYIFLDSLDIDPTFEKYKDDYAVCKKLDGLFEPYTELTPLFVNHAEWDMDYWGKLKYDLKHNFSEKRFEHMIEVAKVIYSEKIERLLAERSAKESINEKNSKVKESLQSTQQQSQSVKTQVEQSAQSQFDNQGRINEQASVIDDVSKISEAEKIRISERKRSIELHNQKIEQERLENERKRAETAKEIKRQNNLEESQAQSKKGMGIVWVVAIAIVIVVVVLLLMVL